MSKRSPEEKEETRRLLERGKIARENMEAIIQRQEARFRAEEERHERRRRFLRRLLPFRRAA